MEILSIIVGLVFVLGFLYMLNKVNQKDAVTNGSKILPSATPQSTVSDIKRQKLDDSLVTETLDLDEKTMVLPETLGRIQTFKRLGAKRKK